MSVGIAITKAMLDSEIASMGVQFNSLFDRVRRFNAAVTAIGSTALQAAPYAYSSAEATTLLAAAGDLDKLRQVYTGAMYVAAGATVNTGVPTANDGTHFGYPFSINVDKTDGFGY